MFCVSFQALLSLFLFNIWHLISNMYLKYVTTQGITSNFLLCFVSVYFYNHLLFLLIQICRTFLNFCFLFNGLDFVKNTTIEMQIIPSNKQEKKIWHIHNKITKQMKTAEKQYLADKKSGFNFQAIFYFLRRIS